MSFAVPNAYVCVHSLISLQIRAKHWTVKGEFPVGPCAERDAEVEVDAAGNVVPDSSSLSLSLAEEGGQIHLDTPGLEGVSQTKFEYLYGRFGGPRPHKKRQVHRVQCLSVWVGKTLARQPHCLGMHFSACAAHLG